uniref:Sterile alpha motif domain containing 11 n=1 Tax=Neogobius melanostomus TaxID=47308 RepID=A0A8C6TXQ0_9GOBI
MSKGILQVHPPICDCPGCRISSPVNRGRLAEKRTIPLPPNRVPKKELASIFSSDDSEGSERASGDHAHIKQEDELHFSDEIMNTGTALLWKLRLVNALPLLLVLRHCFVFTDDLLGKRRSYSPNSSSDCPSESKKSRSVSPKENPQSPGVEAGGSVGHMSPEDHYRRMMSALSEAGSYEEQQQRLYQLASSMGLPGHDLLRARQEALVAAARSPALEAHLPSGSSSSSSQRRKQGLPQHRDAHFTDRDLSHPPPLLSPSAATHITLGPHLRPPFLGMPTTLCQVPGYGFLPPAQGEIFARQQEMLRKQNLARLEMSAELLRQKELENLQRQQRLLGSEADLPDGHPLREELARRTNAMLLLRHGTAPILSLNQQPQSGASTPRNSPGHGSATGSNTLKCPSPRVRDHRDEDMSDSDSETYEDKEGAGSTSSSKPQDRVREEDKDDNRRRCDRTKDNTESSGRNSVPCSSTETDSPSRAFTAGHAKTEVKYHMPPGFMPPLPALHGQSFPFGFPYASPYFHTGVMGGLFADGEESATANPAEDISKWSVEDVCGFISSLAGCAEYTQVFREQAIDGETLPLLTEEHLLNTMGLKLGPALKIRSQVARRFGRLFYMSGFPFTFPFPPALLRPPERDLSHTNRPPSTSSSYSGPTPGCSSPKPENGTSSRMAGRFEAKTPS